MGKPKISHGCLMVLLDNHNSDIIEVSVVVARCLSFATPQRRQDTQTDQTTQVEVHLVGLESRRTESCGFPAGASAGSFSGT